MGLIRAALLVALALGASGCASKFKTYNGPEVTRVLVYKEARKMYLLHHNQALAVYDIDLGFSPRGDKLGENDGRTPEGEYAIDKRNPDSKYHLSIGIDYPRPHDIAASHAMGFLPGGDIFIHGDPNGMRVLSRDWTAGCMAVTNDEMEDIYAMVADGTPISIYP